MMQFADQINVRLISQLFGGVASHELSENYLSFLMELLFLLLFLNFNLILHDLESAIYVMTSHNVALTFLMSLSNYCGILLSYISTLQQHQDLCHYLLLPYLL